MKKMKKKKNAVVESRTEYLLNKHYNIYIITAFLRIRENRIQKL